MDQLGSKPNPVQAWTLFFVFGLLIAAHGVYKIVLPTADPDHWRSYTSDAAVGALAGTYGRFFRRTTTS